MQSIIVKHNVEMAHRLFEQPDSKCYQLHGHSWWVELEIEGPVDETGMILDFGAVKAAWREYLDKTYDHHCCLNVQDNLTNLGDQLSGLVVVMCDPTVENMARIWGQMAQELFGTRFHYAIRVWEASSNAATWRS